MDSMPSMIGRLINEFLILSIIDDNNTGHDIFKKNESLKIMESQTIDFITYGIIP